MDEQPWNRKTILTITDDFSAYTKDVPVTIDVYLTETATKAVATATVKVVDMPFNLVFFKTDHLGTPRVITDQDGKVLSTHDYLAYGEELTDPDFQTNRMKFTGHERDPETGLDYMLARYYTSGSGRFLQVDPGYDYDPMDPMSFNLYAYVRGNPVVGTDPTGKDSVIAIDRDHTKTVKGKDGKEHVVYRATIYKDTTLKEYKNGFVNGKETEVIYVGITAENEKGKEAKKNAKEGEHFGENNDTPPGTYEVTKSDGKKGKAKGWLKFNDPGKPKGIVMVGKLKRDGMSIHWPDPGESQGCVTTSKKEFKILKKALSQDLKNNRPIHMIVPNIYMPRWHKIGLPAPRNGMSDLLNF